jgi:hypothetical protein
MRLKSFAQALHIQASQRTGKENFISCIRKALTDHFSSRQQTVGLGGVFQIEKGTIKAHVMPDFCNVIIPLHFSIFEQEQSINLNSFLLYST